MSQNDILRFPEGGDISWLPVFSKSQKSALSKKNSIGDNTLANWSLPAAIFSVNANRAANCLAALEGLSLGVTDNSLNALKHYANR